MREDAHSTQRRQSPESAGQDFVFPMWDTPYVPIRGSMKKFPVRRIHCVGRNYAEHTREMGLSPEKEAPFFFAKPADAVVHAGAMLPYPVATSNLAHEVELVVAIRHPGSEISRATALDHVFGYAVGIDLTRRDLQLAARERGRPWEAGKSFDASAVISPIAQVAEVGHPKNGRIWLSVNGRNRQDGNLSQLIWAVPEIIEFLSHLVALRPGDLIMTGTPAGVGPLMRGDSLSAGIDCVGELTLRIAA